MSIRQDHYIQLVIIGGPLGYHDISNLDTYQFCVMARYHAPAATRSDQLCIQSSNFIDDARWIDAASIRV
jgi:hypothetical protein